MRGTRLKRPVSRIHTMEGGGDFFQNFRKPAFMPVDGIARGSSRQSIARISCPTQKAGLVNSWTHPAGEGGSFFKNFENAGIPKAEGSFFPGRVPNPIGEGGILFQKFLKMPAFQKPKGSPAFPTRVYGTRCLSTAKSLIRVSKGMPPPC
jgi:hypothetical protein